jgi:hypothetical protein
MNRIMPGVLTSQNVPLLSRHAVVFMQCENVVATAHLLFLQGSRVSDRLKNARDGCLGYARLNQMPVSQEVHCGAMANQKKQIKAKIPLAGPGRNRSAPDLAGANRHSPCPIHDNWRHS